MRMMDISDVVTGSRPETLEGVQVEEGPSERLVDRHCYVECSLIVLVFHMDGKEIAGEGRVKGGRKIGKPWASLGGVDEIMVEVGETGDTRKSDCALLALQAPEFLP